MSKIEIPFGYIEAGKIYLASWSNHPSRAIGEVRDNDPVTSENYFNERFSAFEEKISRLEKQIEESTNKGSFLMKLHHLESNLDTHCGLGDYSILENRIKTVISQINELVAQNQVRNTETKSDLLKEIQKAVLLVNWTEASDAVHDIKHRWIKTGNATPEITKSLDEEFWSLTNDFFERREAFYEDKKKLVLHYESNYLGLIAEAKSVTINGGDRSKVSELKTRWKENGSIDQARYKELQTEFNSALHIRTPVRSATATMTSIREQIESNKLDASDLRKLLTQLKSIRPANPNEKNARRFLFELIGKELEISFVEGQCLRRFPDFESKTVEEKNKLKIQLLKDLLDRDIQELRLMEANSGQFNINDSQIGKQMDQRLFRQKQKISTKESLIRELKGDPLRK